MNRDLDRAEAEDARDPRLTAALRDALALQEAGLATERILARFPECSEALAPLLLAAARLRHLPAPPASEGLTRRIDAALVTAAAERRLERRPERWPERLQERWLGLGHAPALGLAALILAFGLVCAGSLRAASGSLPGSPLYSVKRAVETLRLDLAPAELRAKLAFEQAERRLSEAAALRDLGRAPGPAFAELLSLGAWREELSPAAQAALVVAEAVAEAEAEDRASANRRAELGLSAPMAGGRVAGRERASIGSGGAPRSLAATPVARLGSPAVLIAAAEAARIAGLSAGPAASSRALNRVLGSTRSAPPAPGRAAPAAAIAGAGAPRDPEAPPMPAAASASPPPSLQPPPPPDDDDDDEGPPAGATAVEPSTATPEPPNSATTSAPTSSPSPATGAGAGGRDPGFGIIQGLVLGGVEAQPLLGAQVFFVDALTGDRIGEERSDAEGQFRRRLPRGRYLVTVLAEGHFQQWHDGQASRELADIIGISGDGSTLMLSFRLKPLTASGGGLPGTGNRPPDRPTAGATSVVRPSPTP